MLSWPIVMRFRIPTVLLVLYLCAPLLRGQSLLLIDAVSPDETEQGTLRVDMTGAVETGAIPAITGAGAFSAGIPGGFDLALGFTAVNFPDDDDSSPVAVSRLDGRLSWHPPGVVSRVVPYGGVTVHRGELLWVPYKGDLSGVAAVISPHGDPGLDLRAGVAFRRDAPWGAGPGRGPGLGPGPVVGSVEFARTTGRDHVPDTEWYRNRLFLNAAPILAAGAIGDTRFTVAVQNRLTMWLRRGWMVDVLPQVAIEIGDRQRPLTVFGGVSLPAAGGGVFRFLAGISFVLPRPAPGQERRFVVTDLYFPPNLAVLLGPENERSRENEAILQELYQSLRAYPGWSIVIEGHTSFVHWDDPERGPPEQEFVLLPLSQARADAVRDALVGLGIPADLILTVGKGAMMPAVPFDNPEIQWKNRRVEIVVSPPGEGSP